MSSKCTWSPSGQCPCQGSSYHLSCFTVGFSQQSKETNKCTLSISNDELNASVPIITRSCHSSVHLRNERSGAKKLPDHLMGRHCIQITTILSLSLSLSWEKRHMEWTVVSRHCVSSRSMYCFCLSQAPNATVTRLKGDTLKLELSLQLAYTATWLIFAVPLPRKWPIVLLLTYFSMLQLPNIQSTSDHIL